MHVTNTHPAFDFPQGIWQDVYSYGVIRWPRQVSLSKAWSDLYTGEMHFIPDREDSWFNLPRQGGVAYAAQESWVQNATIRENILFGSTFDEERYNTGKAT